MVVGSGTNLDQTNTCGEGLEGKVDIQRNSAGFEKGVEGGEERAHDGLEPRVGVGEGGLEGFDVGEERLEVIDSHDEFLVVGLADLLDFGLFGSGKVAEVLEKGLRLARCEGLANERAQVLVVADDRGEEELVQLVGGVHAVIGGCGCCCRRSHLPATLPGLHSDARRG